MGRLGTIWKEIRQDSKEISQIINKNRTLIMFDMIGCLLKYKASPNNYKKFEFYNLKSKQRKTYVTYGLSRKMIKTFNKPEDIYVLEDKVVFAEKFSKYFKRKFLNTETMDFEAFEEFCQGQEKFVCKPSNGSQGQGIVVYHINDNLKEIFEEIKSNYNKSYMLEEWIKQHESLSKIYPNAVNCLRIITAYNGKETKFLTGGITFGLSTEIANGSQPSIVAPVDFNTGILHKPASTFGDDLYENHPTTGEPIKGFQVPYWNEIIQMLKDICAELPTVGYIGWDVAITPDGPIVIEGNTTPGYKYYQIPKHLENGIGNKHIYEDALKNRK